MNSMRSVIALFIISFLSVVSLANSVCSIPVEGASIENKSNASLNDRLKNHQKIKSISFSIDLNNLKNEKNNMVRLVFETMQSKKFETVYNMYNKNVNVWKIDFSKSQIFPQLFKNFLNITQFNSKYYLRLYDMPTEKTIVNLVFDSSNCSSGNPTLLTRAASL